MLRLIASALLTLAALAVAPTARALEPEQIERVRSLAETAARVVAPAGSRVMVEAGQLDPRLRLAPCAQVQPFLPPGLNVWGRTRIGLRCLEGPSRWSVTLPVQVHVFGKAIVAAQALPAGANLSQENLAVADIDIASEPGAVATDAAALVGRTLARPMAAGQAIRHPDLKARQWFAAGETVQVSVAGPGFVIGSEAQALSAGMEGQDVKVRFDSGRIVSARPVGERRVEVLL
jgi:flagella basal body P-ring formation protein FlgA